MMGSEISAEQGTFPVLLALVLVLTKVLGTKRTMSLCHYARDAILSLFPLASGQSTGGCTGLVDR